LMADIAVWRVEGPQWDTVSAVTAVLRLRRSILYMFPHCWFMGTVNVAGHRMVGHTLTKQDAGATPTWIQIADDSGSGFKWRAENIVYNGTLINGYKLQFDDNSGGGLVDIGSPLGVINSDYHDDQNSYYFNPAPMSSFDTINEWDKSIGENMLSLSAYAALKIPNYQAILLTGYTKTVTGTVTAPSQVELDASGTGTPQIRYTFIYNTAGDLWRLKIETRRREIPEAYYTLDTLEYIYDIDGRLKMIISVEATAPGQPPVPRLGLLLVGTADFTPDNNSNGEMFDWETPVDATTTLITPGLIRPYLLNTWTVLASLGWGGFEPLNYKMPRFTSGHPTVLFFYGDDAAGDAGRPAAVEMILGNYCIRYENVYSGTTWQSAKWYCDIAFGAGWFKIGEI